MSFFSDFKDFALKWNVVDLAVWVIIGTAFWKIVSSLVADVITPSLWVLLGGIDFTKYSYTVHSLSGWEVTIKYGQFLQSSFDFLIISLSVFVFVALASKALKKPLKKESPKAPDVLVLEEIRDLLAAKNTKKIDIPKEAPREKSTKKGR